MSEEKTCDWGDLTDAEMTLAEERMASMHHYDRAHALANLVSVIGGALISLNRMLSPRTSRRSQQETNEHDI